MFPGTPTFSFDGATYHSRYLTLAAVEEFGSVLSSTAPAGFPPLQVPTATEAALLRRYDDGDGTGGGAVLPFVDIDNRVVVTGAGIGFSPGVLAGGSVSQVAGELADPTNAVSEAVLGAANVLTAALCAATGGHPGTVCRTSAVRAGAARLGPA